MPDNLFSHLSVAAFQTPRHQSARSWWEGHIPFAFWSMERFRPRVFVELGTYAASSYFAFCQSAQTYATGTRCFAVDTWQGDAHAGEYGDEVFEEVDRHNRQHYAGFSRLLRITFDEARSQFADGSIDLLHIDGLHTYQAVRHDFETWLPKMSPRGVVLFHDSNVYKKDFGVCRLMRELDPRYAHFHFEHCYGLSMFALTSEAPEEARWMAALSAEEAETWRQIFSRLGESTSLHRHKPPKKRPLARTLHRLRSLAGR